MTSQAPEDPEGRRNRGNERRLGWLAVGGAIGAAVVAAAAAILSAYLTNQHADSTQKREISAQTAEDSRTFLEQQRTAAYDGFLDSSTALASPLQSMFVALLTTDSSQVNGHFVMVNSANFLSDETKFEDLYFAATTKAEEVDLVASSPVRTALTSEMTDLDKVRQEMQDVEFALTDDSQSNYDDAVQNFLNDAYSSTNDLDAKFQAAIRTELGVK